MSKAETPIASGWLSLRSAQGRGSSLRCCAMGEGNLSAAKGAGAGIFELQMDFGPGYRVYFGKDGDKLVILLGGGSKKRRQSDIAVAQALWVEYKKYKREG